MSSGSLWRRWVGANAIGELLGLGAVGLLAAALGPTLAESPRVVPQLTFAAAMIASGAVEGLIVGYFQWRVLRHALPGVPRGRWLKATIVGALMAWTLGMLPSTVFAVLQPTSQLGPDTEPSNWVVYPAAALLGAVAGLVLASMQWRVLRAHTRNAGWWLPANALAWALGMPIMFLIADLAVAFGYPTAVFLVPAGLLLAGAVVGAVHGVALVRIAGHTASVGLGEARVGTA